MTRPQFPFLTADLVPFNPLLCRGPIFQKSSPPSPYIVTIYWITHSFTPSSTVIFIHSRHALLWPSFFFVTRQPPHHLIIVVVILFHLCHLSPVNFIISSSSVNISVTCQLCHLLFIYQHICHLSTLWSLRHPSTSLPTVNFVNLLVNFVICSSTCVSRLSGWLRVVKRRSFVNCVFDSLESSHHRWKHFRRAQFGGNFHRNGFFSIRYSRCRLYLEIRGPSYLNYHLCKWNETVRV